MTHAPRPAAAAGASDVAVRAEGISKQFGAVEALRGLDLEIAAGTVCGLLGPNGAGKTTFVRILATLLRPSRGRAEVAGFDVSRNAEEVRARIGLTGQYAAVDEDLTGAENLVMFGRLLGMPRRDAMARGDELLERFDLADAGGRVVRTYSGGMRRRLDLAASLVGRPEVVFLDEPTTGLDPRSRIGLWDVTRELVADGTTVLLTTQYLEEADRLADRIAVIDSGTLIAEGTAAELKAQVGGHVVDVRVEPAEVMAARAALEPLGLDVTVTGEGEASTLHVPADGAGVVTDVVRAMDSHGVEIVELEMHAPSLDDVFLALTGRLATCEEEEPESPGPRQRARRAS